MSARGWGMNPLIRGQVDHNADRRDCRDVFRPHRARVTELLVGVRCWLS